MDIQSEFKRAVEASKQKDFQSARIILRDILKEDPHQAQAWILFAHVAQTREHAIYCFERALFLEHDNLYVRQQLNRLRAEAEPPQPTPEPAVAQDEALADTAPHSIPAPQPAANAPLPSSEWAPPKKKKMNGLEMLLLGILGLAVLVLIGILGLTVLQGGGLAAIFSGEPTPSSEVIFAVINDNVSATNAEDLPRYMSAIHPDSPLYAQTEATLSDLFATLDVSTRVYGLQIVKQTRSEIQVAFTMETRKIRGPAFRDNRIQGIFILRKDGDAWKIYDQKIENIEYLN